MGIYSTAIATITLITLGPKTAVMAIARIKPGNAYMLSINKLSRRSGVPPMKAAINPNGTPSTNAMIEELKPIVNATRVPHSIRLHIS